MQLKGIFAAITTPFNHRGDLYISKIRANVARWNRVPVAGYLAAGLAGERPMLSAEERCTLWRETAQARAADKLLLADASAESVRETVSFVKRAADQGFDGAVAGAPRCYPAQMPPHALALFFRAVADQSSIPVVISDDCETCGFSLGTDLVMALSEHPNIVGMIAAGGDAGLTELLRRLPGDFPVLTGSVSALCPALLLGASGAVLDFACPAPYFCLSIEEAVRTREHDAARELQDRASAAIAVTRKYGVAGLKSAMDLQGYYGGIPRLPLVPPGPDAKKEIEAAFRGIES